MPDYLLDAHLDAPNRLALERSLGRRGKLKELFLDPMDRGGIKACFMAIWPEEEHRRDARACFRRSLELLEIAEEEIALEPSSLLVKTGDDYAAALKDPQRRAIFLSAEGLTGLEERMEALDEMRARGVLMAGLTWNEPNALAGGVSEEEMGITPLGRSCLRRMEELGMILDLAHRQVLLPGPGPVRGSRGGQPHRLQGALSPQEEPDQAHDGAAGREGGRGGDGRRLGLPEGERS